MSTNVLERLTTASGDVVRRLRAVEWASNPLGTPETWSSELKTAITQCLTAPTPMFIVWGADRTLVYNDGCVRLLRAEHPHALARPIATLPDSVWPSLGTLVDSVTSTGAPAASKDVTVSPIYRADGSVAGVSCTCLETADFIARAKDEFLAMLCHELRNPLSPLTSALQALQMRAPSPELDLMERQLRQVTRLVDDLQNISRIARGKIELHKHQVELASIVDQGLELANPVLAPRKHQVFVSIPRRGLGVEIDPDRMAQVIANLLTHAASCSDPGSTINVAATREGDKLRIKVTDEGIGIAPDQLSTVFAAFAARPQAGDLGLGLAISKSLVELHGGTISAASAGIGKGTEITVELDAPPLNEEATPSSRIRTRIMLVEDHDDSARALATVLEDLGYQVEVAHNGPVALNVAKVFKPQVVLIDIGLPVMDGYELAKRLRQIDSFSGETPFVAVTAYTQDSYRQKSAEMGFVEHLIKPVDVATIERIVKGLQVS